MKVLGAVLAGGRSSRFGSDKALAIYQGRALIEHAIAALAAQTDAVIVCGRERDDWVSDRPEPGLGPLGGINAALHAARARGYDAVLTAPCDVPALPDGLVERLAPGGFVAQIPVLGLWPVTLAETLDDWLATSPDRSVRRWAIAAGLPAVELAATFANVNTPEDLARLASAPPQPLDRQRE